VKLMEDAQNAKTEQCDKMEEYKRLKNRRGS
jgi:hypothetical protein